MSFFCCKDSFVTFLNCRFILMSTFNWTLQSVPSQGNNVWQARRCWRLNHRVRRFCARLHLSAFGSMVMRRKCYRLRRHGTGIKIWLWCPFFRRPRYSCSEWQWQWQWHSCHYWHKIHTVNWQYKLLTYLFFLYYKEDKLHPWAN
jgi:hypothetical protein